VLERGKLIDSEAKRITAAIAEVEGPIDAMIKAEEERKAEIKRLEEEKELARVRSIQAGITDINSMWARCVGVGSEHILKLLDALEAEEIGEFYAEFAEQARAAKDEAIVRVKRILAEAQEREDEEREELRLREEREAVRRVEEEKLKAEREALAKQKAAQDAKERELAEKEAKQEAERRRVEEEAAEAELMRLLDEQKAEEELAGPPTFSKPSKKEIPDCLLLDRVQMEIEKAFECGFVAGLMASKSGNEHDAGRLSSEYLSDLLSGEVL
jgi:copper chaperone CopZ